MHPTRSCVVELLMEEREESPEPFRIGYALVQKKIKSFVQDRLVRESRQKGIQLIKIDLHRPLDEQGPFDAILHKVPSREWYQGLREYQLARPDVLVVDPPEAVQRLFNRVSMLQAVEQLQYECGHRVGIPKQMVVTSETGLDSVRNCGLSFPLIAKPLVVDGSLKSHVMWIVKNEQGLKQLAPPFILQQFVNHGAVLFKVFVVGSYVKCVRRRSLPGS